jgi:hypothetical protein
MRGWNVTGTWGWAGRHGCGRVVYVVGRQQKQNPLVRGAWGGPGEAAPLARVEPRLAHVASGGAEADQTPPRRT